MVWGMFPATGVGPLTDTWQGECRCLSEPPAATFGSFPAFITQSASNFQQDTVTLFPVTQQNG